MIVDLILQGKEVWVVGGNKECELKAEKLLDAGAEVIIAGKSFTKGIEKLNKSGKVSLIKTRVDRRIFGKHKPYAVVICTSSSMLDIKLRDAAKALGSLVCVVDTPRLNDFNMSAIAKFGDIRVGISTGGASPAMASLLRKRIERVIKLDDTRQVELQAFARKRIKKVISSSELRKKVVYQIARDRALRSLLQKDQFEQAKELARKIIQSHTKQTIAS